MLRGEYRMDLASVHRRVSGSHLMYLSHITRRRGLTPFSSLSSHEEATTDNVVLSIINHLQLSSTTHSTVMPPKTNSKAAAGRERKAQQAAQKKAEDERRITAEQDREWQKGSKSTAKADEAGACVLVWK